MVALFGPSIEREWGSLSFVSTLYLCPVLDRLLDRVPKRWHAEIRLGLQEALVNAVKHGNHLDPQKVISVRYRAWGNQYWWVIEDQGGGFDFNRCCESTECDPTVREKGEVVNECGRGLYILHQIFDEVRWDRGGRELHLCKRVHGWFQIPRVH